VPSVKYLLRVLHLSLIARCKYETNLLGNIFTCTVLNDLNPFFYLVTGLVMEKVVNDSTIFLV
jgi:hypothetical protein